MKWLIYALLLANLSLFVWHYQALSGRSAATDKQASALDADADIQRLRLLGEKDVAASQARVASQCQGIGPFARRKQAQAALASLEQTGVRLRVQEAVLPDKTGHWVYLPPYPTRQAARDAIAKLKAEGIRDYFLIGTGDQKNGISLGVFSTPALATQRAAQVKALGFSPELGTVALAQHQYWLGLPEGGDPARLKRAVDSLAKSYPDVARGQFACEQPTADKADK